MVRLSLRTIVLFGSMFAVAVFLCGALPAMQSVRSADKIETSLLEQAHRFAHNEPVYSESQSTVAPEPALMPGFPFLVASMVGADEPRLWLLRALALAATIAIAVLVIAIVEIESSSWTLALAAGAMALFGQGLFGATPGVARPEPFVLLCVLLGAATLRFTTGHIGTILGAIPFAAAVFLQQQALWFTVAAAFALLLLDWQRGLVFTLAVGVLMAGGYAALSYVFGPWFNYVAWDRVWMSMLPSGRNALDFAADQMLGRLGMFTLVAVLSLAMSTQPWHARRGIWMCLAIGGVLAGMAATQRANVEPAALLSTIVTICLVGTLSLQRVAKHLATTYEEDGKDGEIVILVGLTFQLLVFFAAAIDTPWVRAAMGWSGLTG